MDLAIDQTSPGHRGSLAAGVAGWGLRPVTNVASDGACLTARRAGCIVTELGRLRGVYGRWWPYAGNHVQMLWDMRFRRLSSDRCELYYHAPLGSPGFLTLAYIRSGPATSLSTAYAATLILDEIARLKQANAIVCHVTNERIRDRLLLRWGWQTHCPQWSGRHFIKRFYDHYPSISASWRKRLTLEPT